MLVPRDGLGFVVGRDVAGQGVSECLLSLSLATNNDVDDAIERAAAAGADVVTPAGDQPWGDCAMFTDPDGHAWMCEVSPQPDS